MFPLHTWLPDAHVQAPAPGSVILAGVLLKMGTYGFYRFAFPFFPDATFELRWLLVLLSVIGIVYGSLMCLAQRDIKKLIAYSSVAHLGVVMLGLLAFTTAGTVGAVYQMLNHGVSTGALFLLVGMLYAQRHSREIADYGGIAKVVPAFAVIWLVVTFSSIGLPGTNGFIGEFQVLTGTWNSKLPGAQWWAAIGTTSIILGAVYMLWMYQRVYQGPVTHETNRKLKDLTVREWLIMAPLVALIFIMGLFPTPIIDIARPSIGRFVAQMEKARPELAGDLPASTATRAAALAPPAEAGSPPRRPIPADLRLPKLQLQRARQIPEGLGARPTTPVPSQPDNTP
jgi:NADH-quinone oxidoreductase subunit M